MTGTFRCIRVNPTAWREGPQEAGEGADVVAPAQRPVSSSDCDCGGDLGHRKRGSGSELWVCSPVRGRKGRAEGMSALCLGGLGSLWDCLQTDHPVRAVLDPELTALRRHGETWGEDYNSVT